MIELFTWKTPNGRKVPILLEELGIEYKLTAIDVNAAQRPAVLAQVSANGKIPALVDHDAPGGPLFLFESGAILLYLAEKFGRFLPDDLSARGRALTWTFWHAAGVPPIMWHLRHFGLKADPAEAGVVEHFRREAVRVLGVAERHLEQNAWFAGDEYSVADIMNFPSLAVIKPIFGPLLGELPFATPAIEDWLARVRARPAVQVALAKVDAMEAVAV